MFEKIRNKFSVVVLAFLMMGGNTTAENISEAMALIGVLVDEVATMGGSFLNMIIIFGVIGLVSAIFAILARAISKALNNAVSMKR